MELGFLVSLPEGFASFAHRFSLLLATQQSGARTARGLGRNPRPSPGERKRGPVRGRYQLGCWKRQAVFSPLAASLAGRCHSIVVVALSIVAVALVVVAGVAALAVVTLVVAAATAGSRSGAGAGGVESELEWEWEWEWEKEE